MSGSTEGYAILFVLGQCRRKNRCWFTHEIPESILQEPKTIEAAQAFVKWRSGSKNRNRSVRTSLNEAENTSHEHFNRGPCHMFVLGQCQRGENCWFSHDIPIATMTNENTIEAAKEFAKRRSKSKNEYRNQPHENNEFDNQSYDNNTVPPKSFFDQPPQDEADKQKPAFMEGNSNENNKVDMINNQQPSQQDSFLLLVKTMIQDQLRQQGLSSQLQQQTCPQPQQASAPFPQQTYPQPAHLQMYQPRPQQQPMLIATR